uniref:Uncharacterized protein n=1 Tax=Romanomermis culicivorax TaxID=13658 RepID=A0A915IQ26_ROMCU
MRWREKTVEKTITTAGDLSRYSPSAIPYTSEFDTRASVAGSERYNEKDEIEERLAVRKSELIDNAVEDSDHKPYYRVSQAVPESGLSDWRSKLPPKGDDRFGGATVASYGTGAPSLAGDQSKNFTYFSTIDFRALIDQKMEEIIILGFSTDGCTNLYIGDFSID